ncbi:Tyrosine-protein phosphatase non-receptor type 11 [Frankliniella fusca]|uniref:Tyrosine-protein phosphatase non-receptor type 11 n=1 Tax=Frankliniella fusca TaxID=407009 RepID=A0AAE1LXR6_9NEOP|nr:Tyrosine-protein phosphatase non-receptor type 11 [Frankliniella fusca]
MKTSTQTSRVPGCRMLHEGRHFGSIVSNSIQAARGGLKGPKGDPLAGECQTTKASRGHCKIRAKEKAEKLIKMNAAEAISNKTIDLNKLAEAANKVKQKIKQECTKGAGKRTQEVKELHSLKKRVGKNKGNATRPKLQKALQADHEEINLEDIFKEMIIKIEPVTEIEDPEETTDIKSEAEVAEKYKKEESKTVVFFRLVDDFSVTDNESDEGERNEKNKQQETVNVKRLEAERTRNEHKRGREGNGQKDSGRRSKNKRNRKTVSGNKGKEVEVG